MVFANFDETCHFWKGTFFRHEVKPHLLGHVLAPNVEFRDTRRPTISYQLKLLAPNHNFKNN